MLPFAAFDSHRSAVAVASEAESVVVVFAAVAEARHPRFAGLIVGQRWQPRLGVIVANYLVSQCSVVVAVPWAQRSHSDSEGPGF